MQSKGYTCLAHVTTHTNYATIQEHGAILSPHDRYNAHVNARGVYSYCDFDFSKPYTLGPGDLPGVYMSLVYDMNTLLVPKEDYMKDVLVLLFPLELLEQRNWHFNLVDRCGTIGYDTYFPETIDQSPHVKDILEYYGEEYIGNEVIFHHSVPLQNASHILTTSDGVMKKNPSHNLQLNMNLKRMCVFYSDMYYTGRPIPYYKRGVTTTSDEFYIDFIRRELPTEFKYLCDGAGVHTKYQMEKALEDLDLFTQLNKNNHETVGNVPTNSEPGSVCQGSPQRGTPNCDCNGSCRDWQDNVPVSGGG